MQFNLTAITKHLLTAITKYLTNHVMSHVPSYGARHIWYRRALGWYIGPSAAVLMGLHVQPGGMQESGRKVSIGSGTIIWQDCMLSTRGGLVIGENVCVSPGVWLMTGTDDVEDRALATQYDPIVIGDYAWIGPRAVVMSGVTIGRGAIVMAGAVVTRDLEPFAIAGGVPAQVVGTRALKNPRYKLAHPPLFE